MKRCARRSFDEAVSSVLVNKQDHKQCITNDLPMHFRCFIYKIFYQCLSTLPSNCIYQNFKIIFGIGYYSIGHCTDQVIGCDDVDKRNVGGQEVNIVAVYGSGVLRCT